MTSIQSTVGPRSGWTYPGARALVHLHERELRQFLEVWRRAEAADLALPATEDPTCAALDPLLHHVLRAACGYLVGVSGMLGLPAPKLPELAPEEEVAAGSAAFLEHLLDAWRGALRTVTEEQVERTTGEVPWGVTYSVDALLEHAVMHPMRHRLQIEELLGEA